MRATGRDTEPETERGGRRLSCTGSDDSPVVSALSALHRDGKIYIYF